MTFWARDGDWTFQEAALHGSSHYDLPGVLRWFTANIGVHHVHHLHQDLETRDSRGPPRLSQHPRPGGTELRYQPLMVTEQEAIAIARGIAPHVIRFAASIVAPLCWVTREPNGAVGTRNGTAFFLRTSEALFGVTTAHVIEGTNGWRTHCEIHGKTNLGLGAKEGSSVAFDWDARCVDINLEMDIATFTVHAEREKARSPG
jgi:hypothetical protein